MQVSIFKFRAIRGNKISITSLTSKRTLQIFQTNSGNIGDDVKEWFVTARKIKTIGMTSDNLFYYVVTEFLPNDKF